MKRLKSVWPNAEGSVLLELSALLPLLFSLAFGVFEFSLIFYRQQLIESGIRDAARYLARIPLTTASATPCTQTDANGNTYASYAKNIAVYGKTSSSGATARVSGWGTGNVTLACPATSNSGGTYHNLGGGDTTVYTISASTTFAVPTLGFFGLLGLSVPTMTVTHKERFIGAS